MQNRAPVDINCFLEIIWYIVYIFWYKLNLSWILEIKQDLKIENHRWNCP